MEAIAGGMVLVEDEAGGVGAVGWEAVGGGDMSGAAVEGVETGGGRVGTESTGAAGAAAGGAGGTGGDCVGKSMVRSGAGWEKGGVIEGVKQYAEWAHVMCDPTGLFPVCLLAQCVRSTGP